MRSISFQWKILLPGPIISRGDYSVSQASADSRRVAVAKRLQIDHARSRERLLLRPSRKDQVTHCFT